MRCFYDKCSYAIRHSEILKFFSEIKFYKVNLAKNYTLQDKRLKSCNNRGTFTLFSPLLMQNATCSLTSMIIKVWISSWNVFVETTSAHHVILVIIDLVLVKQWLNGWRSLRALTPKPPIWYSQPQSPAQSVAVESQRKMVVIIWNALLHVIIIFQLI